MNTFETASKLKSSPLGSVFVSMLERIKNLYDVNDQYKELVVSLNGLLDAGYHFNSPEIQGIVNVLRELPSYGTRQRNFERMYLQDEYTLRKLPSDPNKIPFGYWAR
ncbi:hypothetical protein [Vibrio sp. MEBiC08052]|uniref:hypothetical protein n=1 Tax=Vibrio sp. MEBiC08052 TaxID=1761910 RepID=UPI0007407F14|nr:hypothetical protein [Vibrio sp. MEBiC08052]KUJ00760.1 hypothetical protein VRK_02620 [Vibrio sp. MEBiC08052]